MLLCPSSVYIVLALLVPFIKKIVIIVAILRFIDTCQTADCQWSNILLVIWFGIFDDHNDHIAGIVEPLGLFEKRFSSRAF